MRRPLARLWDLFVVLWADEGPPVPVGPAYELAASIRGARDVVAITAKLDQLAVRAVASTSSITGLRDAPAITAKRDSISIRGADPVPASDPISMPAGASRSIAWTPVGFTLPSGTGLIFSVKDGNTGQIWLQKKSAAAGGSDNDFTPPVSGTGPGYINVAAADTAMGRPGQHQYDVKVIYPDGTDDFPSVGSFTLTDHPNR